MLRTSCAVVGHPVDHSLSPAIHAAAYARLGLDWDYDRIDLPPGELPGLVQRLLDDPRRRWRGLSVTMPHKDDAARLGAGDDLVSLTGVANTVVLDEGRISVHNTDVSGFVLALRQRAGRLLEPGFRATIVGNGATARSALVALHQLGCGQVQVVCRSAERADAMVELGERLAVPVSVRTVGQRLEPSEVLVSTVPARGSAELARTVAGTAQVVFDSVYDPWPTPLVEAVCGGSSSGSGDPSTGSGDPSTGSGSGAGGSSAGSGVVVLDGLDLLAGQAVEQVRWFTGMSIEMAEARTAAQDALRAGSGD